MRTSVYTSAFLAGLAPDPLLTVSEWADQHRRLPQRASAEPGFWRTERTPYLREIMDALSAQSSVETIVLMKGAQIGGTECGNNWIGYIIDNAPGPIMAVQPTVEMAKRVSRQRLAPLIEESPRLRDKVKDPRSRDSGNTMLSKEFPGGLLILTGANSAVGLRSMPVRYLFLDEIDGYPGDADNEGDPVDLAIGRTRTFARKKILMVSTPTITGRSRIEKAFLDSDQRYYHVPCPLCGFFQSLKWPQLRWEKNDPGSVSYICEQCNDPIEERYKTQLLAQGKWVSHHPGATTRGYHLSALYSPLGWFSWQQAVTMWEKAKGNPIALRVFINTVLGETWQEQGEAPDWRRLYERRESYAIGQLPNLVVVLTAGVDVQKDRLECSVVGWNRQTAWLIDHLVLPGDPAQSVVWQDLDNLLRREWQHTNGHVLRLRLLAIDTGYLTNAVYAWVRRQSPRQVIAIKGRDNLQAPIGQPKSVDIHRNGKRLTRGVKVWPVGVSVLKTDLYNRLKLSKPTDEELKESGYPAAYIHFPQLSEEYFKQLTAEQLLSRLVKGYRKYQWEKIYERNEALDCFVYAMAAYYAAGLQRWDEADWRQLEDQLHLPASDIKSVTQRTKNIIQRRVSSFW